MSSEKIAKIEQNDNSEQKSPTVGSDFPEEFKLAKQQNRQPRCVSCKEPLDVIRQTQYDHIAWKWNSSTMRFEKQKGSGDADRPHCSYCDCSAWEMLDEYNGMDNGVSY